MPRGCGLALASIAAFSVVVFTGVVLYVLAGPQDVVIAVLLAPLLLCGIVIAHDVFRRRAALAAEEQRLLAQERDHVRRTVDLVMDPDLAEEERLAVLDCFVPRLAPADPDVRDRFVVVSELSPPSRALLARARKAVTTVYASLAMRRRLLDGLANEVLLPRQIWELATLLQAQTHLQEEQHRARQGVVTPELLAVLEPQQEALDRSVAAVAARVEGLERYARRVQEADAALRAREALDNNDKYRALLAHTDDTDGMRTLAAHGDALEETLARSVREAIEAGQTLAP
ncbi:hypothetical protein ETD86_04410 [Nonomuraea turkmeniaca]|uniref:Uncharacterized protein n=1 Tax=Nonomuraea turkmeniaca TaxID=103838 RepID=A0A5S4FWT5_9ACTN|nr:hypothetical protein [Nonomuraea turkmeniaca]TMR24591.1 hypothetical protein ETD86_04410 [Nonomuraea turkmeniaca]